MGAKQTLFGSLGYQPDEIDITGEFAPNGASNPVVTSNVGDRNGGIWSVVRTGVGLYLVTFADTYFARLYAGCELTAPAASANWAQVVGYNPTNATVNSIAPATMQIRVVNSAGTATEVGPTAGMVIDFWVGATQNANGGR